MFFKIGINRFIPVGQVLDVSPGPEHLRSTDPPHDILILRKVRLVYFTVVPEEESAEVKS